MPSSLIATNVLAGPFTGAYTPPSGSGGSIGIIGPEGVRWSRQLAGEPITSDQYGRETILDGVYTGGNLFLEFLLQEANSAIVKAMAYAFSGAPSSTTTALFSAENELGNPGQLWSAACGSLVLTPVQGSPAWNETTPVRTFGLCGPAMGHTLDAYLRAGMKSIPMRMLCLPYSDGGSPAKTVWFTKAAHS